MIQRRGCCLTLSFVRCMVRQKNMPSVAYLLIAWGLVSAPVLLWARRSRRSEHERSTVSYASIATRILIVLTAVYCLLHLALGVPLGILALCLPIALLFIVTASTDSMPGGPGAIEFSFWLMFFLPCFAIKQFVLGYRDIPLLIPEPEFPVSASESVLESIPSSTGRVVAQLRPFGQVDFCGQTYQAVSHDSRVIDNDTSVVVCGTRGRILIVREGNTGPSCHHPAKTR